MARHEWIKKNERISDEAYQKYFELFDPDLFNPCLLYTSYAVANALRRE